jgi:serine-type D-Ala-D-Ala carboxypeptidase/endopeptidase (penicillin-binding protein 4)
MPVSLLNLKSSITNHKSPHMLTTKTKHNRAAILLLASLCLLTAGCSWGRTHSTEQSTQPTLAQKLNTILHTLDDTGTLVSARFIEAPSGKIIFQTDNNDYPFKPASNMKLLVSATALDHFGSNHTFKTYLAIDKQDLWIIGTGDPATGDPVIAKDQGALPTTILDQWAKALKDRGITEIKGDLLYDDLALDAYQRHPTWNLDDLQHWYAAPVSGLAFNDNCIDITVTPAELGNPANYTVMPPIQNITVINNTISGKTSESTSGDNSAGNEHNPAIVKLPGSNTYEISGTVTKQSTLKSKPVENPGAFFADALKTNLQSHGIQILGNIRRAQSHLDNQPIPSKNKTIAIHESRIEDILARINKPSQNLFAEMLCKATGRDYQRQLGKDEPGSWLNGKFAIKAFLEKANINTHPLVVADGSGLSHNNRVTTKLISSLLLHMNNHPDAVTFINSLTIGGVDGTIRKRFTNDPGKVRGKTGYISGVRALSGYIETDAGPTVVFSILYNGFSGTAKPYEKLQDEAVTLVMREYQPTKK